MENLRESDAYNSTPNNLCAIYGMPYRPVVCRSYQISDTCGKNREEALHFLTELETITMKQDCGSDYTATLIRIARDGQ